MKRKGLRGAVEFAAFSLVVIAACAALGLFVYGEVENARRHDADNVLASFQQTITLKLRGDLSQTSDFVAALKVDPDDESWLAASAAELLERDEAIYMGYVVDETMRYAFPEDRFADLVGRDLTQFTYVYTLAKWIDGFVVEGPVELSNGMQAFLFIEPVDVDGAYYGEIAVGLKAEYVIDQLDLSMLEDEGYLYELWAVSPQDGRKDIIAVSNGGHDFSHGAKTSFDMPTQWTLSIMPADGWVPQSWMFCIAACSVGFALLVVVGAFMALRIRRMRQRIEREKRIDQETGMFTYDGFVETFDKAAGGSGEPLTLICLMVDDFEKTAFAISWEARRCYLGKAREEIDAVVHSSHVEARIGSGAFVVAVRERIETHALADLMRALELALMWKVRIDGKKTFCRVRSAAVYYPEDGADLTALVERTISLLERDKPESCAPARKRQG